jgi:hypothetical protein
MKGSWIVAFALVCAAGCGDNATECGQGTKNKDGVCTPTATCGPGTKPDTVTGQCVPDGSMVCTDGTVFDPETSTCNVDPNACQDGTVLIGGQCVDPTHGLVVDVEEGPEPNGLGLLGETSNNPAGLIVLKPIGQHFVIHGHITPFEDNDGDGLDDADVDAYTVQISGPSLLHVTADGVHGLAAGFVAVDNVVATDPLASWIRYGINLTGDTSDRQLFLPAAGTYIIAISDTRSLFLQGGAAGSPTAEYYATIDAVDMPAPTPLSTATVSDKIGGDVVFYAPPMGTGINDVRLDMPQVQANASVVTLVTGAFKGFSDEGTDAFGNPTPAEMDVGGVTASDVAVVVIDDTYNYATGSADYTLTVTPSDAQPLSTTGGTVSQTEQINGAPQGASDVPLLGQYYLDVTAADQTIGLSITWNHPVRGALLDGGLQLIASFTSFGSSDPTWTTFAGLLRFRHPGRYYFLVYDPAGTAGTTQLSATSKITTPTPVAITESTPTGAQTFDPAIKALPFTYDAGTDPWQTFNATGVNTGGQGVSWYDPSMTYGRLDALTASTGPVAADATPIFSHQFTAAGGAIGRILLDDPTTSYYVKVNAVAPTTTATATLTFNPRTIIDLGTIAAGSNASATSNPLGGATPTGYVLFRSAAGDPATVTVHPQATTLNTRFRFVNADESFNGAVINTSNNGDDTTLTLPTHAWTAFEVTAQPNPATAQPYDVTVAIGNPVVYAETPGTTAFTSICGTPGAVNIAFTVDGTGNGPANDEGLSAAFNAPNGFTFYGVAAPTLRVSTNGWLTFGTPVDAAFANQHIPDPAPPNAVVAPYWDDLANVTACHKLVGTKLTIQWDGTLFGSTTAVHTQAILDGAAATVELVWAATQGATGDSATIGLEDPAGANATQHSFNTAGAITPGTSSLFTPM